MLTEAAKNSSNSTMASLGSEGLYCGCQGD